MITWKSQYEGKTVATQPEDIKKVPNCFRFGKRLLSSGRRRRKAIWARRKVESENLDELEGADNPFLTCALLQLLRVLTRSGGMLQGVTELDELAVHLNDWL